MSDLFMHPPPNSRHALISVMILDLFTSACTSLPEVRYLNTSLTAPDYPTVTNARGTLSISKNKTLLNKRWHHAYADMATLAALEEAATGRPLISGNKVSLLFDGPQTMAAMMAAITTAQHHIHLETYIFDQDAIGIAFADLLIARQAAGVQVNIIYDSIGTIGTPQAFFDRMRDAGIKLVAFNPVNPLQTTGQWEPNHRDHRKILIVDGVVAFTGGVNISASYANSSLFRSKNKRQKQIGWRDTHIKIEGPAVAALQWVFLATWDTHASTALTDTDFFPPLKEAGKQLVRVLASEPGGSDEIYKAYVLAIQQAEKTIHITSAYFVPDAQILLALCEASQRGVDVRIILPSVTDSGLVFQAGQSFYDEMLANGIRIYELQIAVLHAKTAVIDGVWSTVGSTNIDTRSFLHNNEINIVVFGTEFAQTMESTFDEDLRYSVEMTKEKWVARPWSKKFKEWAARRFEYWL